MGCGASTAGTKAALASAEFSSKLSWSGISAVTGVLKAVKTGKDAGQLQDTEGTSILNIVPSGDRAWCFNEPASGTTVVLVCLTQLGNFFSGKRKSEWTIFTSKDSARTGQPPEATPIGTTMYKFGALSMPLAGPMEYLDPSGAKLFFAKPGNGMFITLIDGTDGTSPAAVVEGLAVGGQWKATCTFAKGVDPIIAIIMGVQAMSLGD
jgi:hypothetical protein